MKSGKGGSYEVKWDALSKDTYVSCVGWTGDGKSPSAAEATRKAAVLFHNR